MTARTRLCLTVFLGSLAAMAPLAMDMYLPGLPELTADFSASASLAQLSLTMTMVGMALGQLLGGPLGDMYGRRRPLILGMVAFALASGGCFLAQDMGSFLLCRFLQGLAGAFGVVMSRAIARDLAEGAELTRLFSMLMLVNGLAPVLAPVIGGQMLLLGSWRGVFLLLAVIGLILALASLVFRESLPREKRQSSLGASFRNFPKLLQDPYFLGHCLLQSFFFGAFFAYISGSSFLFQNIYQVSAQVYAFTFGGLGACIALTGTLPVRLAGRVPDVSMLFWSLGQGLAGGLLLLLCVEMEAALPLTLLALLVFVPMVSILGATSFSLAMRTCDQMAGSAAALLGFCQMLAGGLAAPLVGLNGDHDALPMAWCIIGGTGLALIFFLIFIWPKHRRGGRMGRG